MVHCRHQQDAFHSLLDVAYKTQHSSNYLIKQISYKLKILPALYMCFSEVGSSPTQQSSNVPNANNPTNSQGVVEKVVKRDIIMNA
ncbi:hypothetical protein T01_9515 [Trichinella spiralis]|uniref:Uncharacterized protein n=1 Tax=Trichinella spiralis TaxID=6334 RepID=A0A0V1ANW8_TRISP|nr:hypothetical protein T01_9515 [Trichinella spiralis]